MKKVAVLSMVYVLMFISAVFAASTPAPAPKSAQAKAIYDKALTAGQKGNYKESMEGFKKVTEIEPSYALAYNGWGICLMNLTRNKEAIGKFSKAVELNPKFGKAYYNWGLVLANTKDYAGASEKFRKTVELEPEFSPAYESWGLSLVELGKYDEAIEKFKKISQLDPKRTNDINKIIANVKKMKADRAAKGTKKK